MLIIIIPSSGDKLQDKLQDLNRDLLPTHLNYNIKDLESEKPNTHIYSVSK